MTTARREEKQNTRTDLSMHPLMAFIRAVCSAGTIFLNRLSEIPDKSTLVYRCVHAILDQEASARNTKQI
jgi:hypothetical protein